MLDKELTAATLRPSVMAVLAQGENYGYEIIRMISELSDEKIEWAEGALYPLLHRLEHQGLVESSWRNVPNGRRRKYYRLRAEGKVELDRQQAQWNLASDLLSKLWEPNPCLT
jgi:PadR family transcriptional regulator